MRAHETLLSRGLLNAVACLFPGLNATCQRFSVRKPFLLISFCLTGRSAFIGSSAVKDDLLILRYGICLGRKMFQLDRTFEMILLERLYTRVSAGCSISNNVDAMGLPVAVTDRTAAE
jgi:hypothetical protein